MAKTSKPEPPIVSPTPVSARAALIDELGQLEKELAPLKTKISRVEALRKILRAEGEAALAAEELRLEGLRFVAIIGPRGQITLIDYPSLLKIVKPAGFAKFATCTLEALRGQVSAEQFAQLTRAEQLGPRSLKVLEKGTATTSA